jgi:hypothetical protein
MLGIAQRRGFGVGGAFGLAFVCVMQHVETFRVRGH